MDAVPALFFGTVAYLLYSVHSTGTIQCCGSVTYWYGSGSGDQCQGLTDPDSDPDPGLFLLIRYFLKVRLVYSSKIKSHKEITVQ